MNTDTADRIKAAVGHYFKKKKRAVYTELGLIKGGRLRADVFAMAMNGFTVIVECKSSLADYRSDKKLELYRDHCHQFYLAMPESVYNKVKDTISPGIGVFIMNSELKIKIVKPARRQELSPEDITRLAIRAAFRSQDNPRRKNKPL